MRYLLYLFSLLYTTSPLRAQVYKFQHLYGSSNAINSEGTDVLTLPTGDMILTGNRTDNTNGIYLGMLVKMNSQGIIQWCKNFSDGGRQRFYSVDTIRSGGFVIGGSYYDNSSNSNPNYKALIIKTDNSGSLLWSRIIVAPYRAEIFAIHECSDGGFIAAGMANDSISGPKMMMLKTDNNGNLLWANRYGSTLYGKEYGWDLLETSDSSYVSVGNSATIGAGAEDMCVIKVNTSGSLLWAKTYGGIYGDGANAIVKVKNENNFLVLGSSKSFSQGGVYEFYLLKIDLNGNLLWSKTYSASGLSLTGVSLFEGPGNNINLFGNSGIGPPADYLLIRTDSAGNVQWSKKYDASVADFTYKIRPTAYNGMVMAGRCAFPYQHIYLVKTDVNGNSGCNETVMNITSSIPTTLLDSGGTAFPFGIENAPSLIKTDLVLPDSVVCFSLGIKDPEKREPLELFPNPSTGIFSLELDESASLTILNIFGQVVHATDLMAGITQIDLSGLAKGIYFVSVNNKKGIRVIKLVLQ